MRAACLKGNKRRPRTASTASAPLLSALWKCRAEKLQLLGDSDRKGCSWFRLHAQHNILRGQHVNCNTQLHNETAARLVPVAASLVSLVSDCCIHFRISYQAHLLGAPAEATTTTNASKAVAFCSTSSSVLALPASTRTHQAGSIRHIK